MTQQAAEAGSAFEQIWQVPSAATLFRIASLTKPLGATLVLSLVEDGVLALEDEIARWLPEAASPSESRPGSSRDT